MHPNVLLEVVQNDLVTSIRFISCEIFLMFEDMNPTVILEVIGGMTSY